MKSIYKSVLVRVPVNKIEKHDLVKKIEESTTKYDRLSPYLLFNHEQMSQESIVYFSDLNPLLLIEQKSRYCCISGTRLLHLAQMTKAPIELTAIVISDQRNEWIKRRVIIDYHFTPLIYGLNKSGIKHLINSFVVLSNHPEWHEYMQKYMEDITKSDAKLAKFLGVSRSLVSTYKARGLKDE